MEFLHPGIVCQRVFILGWQTELTNIDYVAQQKILIDQPLSSLHLHTRRVDPGCPVVIILASGSEVCGFDPGRGRLIFSERKNPEYDFLCKGSKAVGPVPQIYST